ncbi:FecCD family ABC transporter permease [Parvimonas micra]|uniref:Iron ABC transporter permease n=1 Tax=Parvimonas micra TaxID=33033 RepID=A0A9X3HE74_9FIRM|nr:iron ABC transporter permease [Parvimonas micra]MCZ7407053.1 iron ABC transporter permease [Parvimonas micra]MCZ7409817.1 iron ABC transporter permease [Parvimonas micra]MCZ7411585.1 iron ABC transporter permease [Parvimonas micra]WBB37495.1 iron ABC transporter permease [Parvimonas micra]
MLGTGKHSKKSVILSLIGLLLCVCIFSMMLGKYSIQLEDILTVLKNRIFKNYNEDLKVVDHIIINIRLPRVILAGMVGAGLSISGSSLQGTFQNSLVSPDILGVCSGAGFGAALGILFFDNNIAIVTGLPFLFGILSIVLVFFLSGSKKKGDNMTLVLSGIIVSSIFNALTSLVKYVADTKDKLPTITFWLMGSFSNTTYREILISTLPIFSGLLGLIMLRWKLNLLSLGDEDAYTLGINPKQTRWLIIIFSTLITAACVAVSGIVGWVGLVIPHICRKIVGNNHDKLLPISCLVGAIFMIVIDTIARNVVTSEIPIGILTALIGAPFFAIIYRKSQGGV